MKIQIICRSVEGGFYKVSITVMDSEDFPTELIFQHERDFPGISKFTLTPGSTDTINNIFHHPSIAERWAERQVGCLQEHLKKWRRPDELQNRIMYI